MNHSLEQMGKDYKEAQESGKPILKPNVGWVLITEPMNEGKTGNLKSAVVLDLHHQDLAAIGLPVMVDPSVLAAPPGRRPTGTIVSPSSCIYCNNMNKNIPKPILVPETERDYLVPISSVVAWKWNNEQLPR